MHFIDFVDGANVRVIQGGSRFRFPNKALAAIFILQQMGREKLERNGSFKIGVLGFVDGEILQHSLLRQEGSACGLSRLREDPFWFFGGIYESAQTAPAGVAEAG